MLAEVLTQGRALGVVVVACVQDPRKDVVGMRGLFTQTVALRLRSAEETVMVLGDGMSKVAPAHRISPTHPGTAWVVDDTGAADRVRADFWPDPLIRDLSRRYATEVHSDIRPEDGGTEPEGARATSEVPVSAPRAPRKPRTPRQSRQDRSARQDAVRDVPEDGAA
jgi:S-DNA-T family DNA segregation ATPase FtsK/SpoIIIE